MRKHMNKRHWLIAGMAVVALSTIGIGCSKGDDTTSTGTTGTAPVAGTSLKGEIKIDGSSTVFPISQAVAEEFGKAHSGVNVTVGSSGTSGGFKKFISGEVDICNASRPIAAEEVAKLKEAGIDFVELPVAFDGLSVVVNPENTWAETLTVAELKKMWEPDSQVNNWKDVRPGFPDEPIKLFGAGTDSGTFDYWTEAIMGKKGASRKDAQVSEDDNVLVQGVAGEKGGLGYFGFAYYMENKGKVKIVKIDGGSGPIEPNEASINDGTYAPLSRPLFIYVSKKALERGEVKEFIKYYLSSDGRKLASEVGYVALPDKAYEMAQKHADELKTGTRFAGNIVGLKIEDVLAKDSNDAP
jgi:phosphate transport system substrate-binding protein